MENKNTGGSDRLLHKLYGKYSGRLLLRIMISPSVSKITGWFLDRRISRIFIKRFAAKNNIDLSQSLKDSFKSFNDFFTRELKAHLREPDMSGGSLISPCDSCLSAYTVEKDKTFRIKSSEYTIEELLGSDEISGIFDGGMLLVFRLRPVDYHRYIYFDGAVIESEKHIQGTFHTVNPVVHDHYKVYASNTREYAVLKTDNFGTCIQMEVGAMLVGRIKNIRGRKRAERGEERGYFEFGGSTVILLLQKDTAVLDERIPLNITDELFVMRGERIGSKAK